MIFALRDCYIDELATGNSRTGSIVFRLNTFELDRETFKLAQELTLLKITEERLEQSYVEELVIAPLQAAVQLAESDAAAAEDEFRETEERHNAGQVTSVDVALAKARLAERRVIWEKSRIDLGQRSLELEVQRRKFEAEQDDLKQRIELNSQIRKVHQFSMPFEGYVEAHTYAGAFVEEGDPICTVSVL